MEYRWLIRKIWANAPRFHELEAQLKHSGYTVVEVRVPEMLGQPASMLATYDSFGHRLTHRTNAASVVVFQSRDNGLLPWRDRIAAAHPTGGTTDRMIEEAVEIVRAEASAGSGRRTAGPRAPELAGLTPERALDAARVRGE